MSKTNPEQVWQIFVMHLIALTVQAPRYSQQLVTPILSRWKVKQTKNLANFIAFTFLRKAPLFWCNTVFFNQIICRTMTKSFQNTLTFDWYLFYSRSIMLVHLVYWNSLHPFIKFSHKEKDFLWPGDGILLLLEYGQWTLEIERQKA